LAEAKNPTEHQQFFAMRKSKKAGGKAGGFIT